MRVKAVICDGECNLGAVMSMIRMYVLAVVGSGYGQLCNVEQWDSFGLAVVPSSATEWPLLAA